MRAVEGLQASIFRGLLMLKIGYKRRNLSIQILLKTVIAVTILVSGKT